MAKRCHFGWNCKILLPHSYILRKDPLFHRLKVLFPAKISITWIGREKQIKIAVNRIQAAVTFLRFSRLFAVA